MAKWCFNYESGTYELIERDGFSLSSGRYVACWDDSEYKREEKEEKEEKEAKEKRSPEKDKKKAGPDSSG